MKKLIILLLSSALLVLNACNNTTQPNEAAEEESTSGIIQLTPEQKQIAGIETGKLEKRLVADAIDCTGFIDVPPTNKGTLHAPTDGIIETIHVVPGKKVKQNESLATLADQEIVQIQEQYLFQKSQVAFWETEFQRKQKLYKGEAISKKDFLKAQNDYNQSKYRLESLSKQLILLGISEEDLIENGISSSISIRAPFNGYVSDVFVNIGMYVDEHKPMFEIVNYDHVHLELAVYSNDIGKVELGQAVRFRFTGSARGGWGTIQLLGKKVDEEERSVLVHAHIDEYDHELTIGASIMAEILTNADSALCIPDEAIISEGDINFIFTEQTNGFIKTPVNTGRKYNGFTEILNSAKLIDKSVVTKGAYYLVE